MELLMAQLAAINEASASGLLSEKVASSANDALLNKLHESKEKQQDAESSGEILDAESEPSTISDRTETLTKKLLPNEPELTSETFNQLAPPDVDDLLGNSSEIVSEE